MNEVTGNGKDKENYDDEYTLSTNKRAENAVYDDDKDETKTEDMSKRNRNIGNPCTECTQSNHKVRVTVIGNVVNDDDGDDNDNHVEGYLE